MSKMGPVLERFRAHLESLDSLEAISNKYPTLSIALKNRDTISSVYGCELVVWVPGDGLSQIAKWLKDWLVGFIRVYEDRVSRADNNTSQDMVKVLCVAEKREYLTARPSHLILV